MNLVQFLMYSLTGVLLSMIFSVDVYFSIPQFVYGFVSESPRSYTTYSQPKPTSASFAIAGSRRESIIFVGDVLLARNVEYLMDKFGSNYPFQAIEFSKISANPFVIGNFEATIPKSHLPTQPLMMNFSVNHTHLDSLKSAGFSHFSLANNHSYDYGKDGLINTQGELMKAGLSPFGNPKKFDDNSVKYIELQGKQLAIIGLQALEENPSGSQIEFVLGHATKQSDYQIVYVHWGNEYEMQSSDSQHDLAERLVAAGADLIVGHHPHVVQEIELVNDVPVFYSLGNYIFDQYFSSDVQEGLLLSIDLLESPVVHIIPVSSEFSLSQPSIMKGEAHQDFLVDLARRSNPKINEYIRAGVLPLDIPVASSVKMAMIKP